MKGLRYLCAASWCETMAWWRLSRAGRGGYGDAIVEKQSTTMQQFKLSTPVPYPYPDRFVCAAESSMQGTLDRGHRDAQ